MKRDKNLEEAASKILRGEQEELTEGAELSTNQKSVAYAMLKSLFEGLDVYLTSTLTPGLKLDEEESERIKADAQKQLDRIEKEAVKMLPEPVES